MTATRTSYYRIPLPTALHLGLGAAVVLTLASFSGGATRNRGGVLEALNIGFLAYGHGRNVGIILYWVGLFGLVAAWVLAGRQIVAPTMRGAVDSESALRRVRRLVACWVAPLALAGPLASRDVYSYLMQGAMVRDGFDPYSEGAAANPGPFLLEVSHDWRNTTTPYGPAHLWLGEGVTRLVGDNVGAGVIAYKVISLLGFAAIVWAVPKIARHLGSNPSLALWLGVANPVMLLHLVGGMHNESVMVGLVSVALVWALRRRFIGALLLVGVAVAMKATAVLVAPFIVWLMVQHYGGSNGKVDSQGSLPRRWAAFVLSGLVTIVGVAIPVALVTWASGSSWGWLSQISGNSKVVNPLAGPTLAADTLVPLIQIFDQDVTYNAVLELLRRAAAVVMLAGLVVVWWLGRRTRRHAVAATAGAYQVAFIFNAVTLPWYYASIFSLMGTFKPALWLIKCTTGIALFMGVAFAGDGNHQLYNWWWDIAMVIIAWWASQWIFARVPEDYAGCAAPSQA